MLLIVKTVGIWTSETSSFPKGIESQCLNVKLPTFRLPSAKVRDLIGERKFLFLTCESLPYTRMNSLETLRDMTRAQHL